MKVNILRQVNERTRDGRVFSAGEDSIRTVDDADTDLVALVRDMAARGVVEIVKMKPEPEPEQKPAAEEPKKAAPAKAAKASPA